MGPKQKGCRYSLRVVKGILFLEIGSFYNSSRVLPFSNPFSQFSDIYKNISNQTVYGLIDFHSRKNIYYGSQ